MLLRIPSLVRTLHNVVLLCVPSLCRKFWNRDVNECYFSILSILEDLGVHEFSFYLWLVLAEFGVNDFPSLNGQSLRALVFEYIT